jgi:uncharacterized protein involved in exopolysaccharide biosynthesis
MCVRKALLSVSVLILAVVIIASSEAKLNYKSYKVIRISPRNEDREGIVKYMENLGE